jgi:predicted transcriptional regulator
VSTRTTLTLDDDVADRIKAEARRSGRPYRAVVNDAIRRGLDARVASEPFTIRSGDMGLRPGIDLDDIEGLLDRLDGPLRR